jgi:hypothetical protein
MTAMPPEPGASPLATDPDVAATVRLLHRRQTWGRAAATSFLVFLLAAGGASSAQSQGTPPPTRFEILVLVLAALTVVGIVAAVADTVLLRRRPSAARAQAVPLAAQHRGRRRAHHYPPRHPVIWTLRWIGMLLFLVVGVISVPAVVDGVAYLAGAENTATFDPIFHETNCDQYSCQTTTSGIMQTGSTSVQATWPDVVPLGKPFRVREPLWRWGLGQALIDSDGIAIAAVVISLLIQGTAVLIVIRLIQLARNWRRHRQQRTTPGRAELLSSH